MIWGELHQRLGRILLLLHDMIDARVVGQVAEPLGGVLTLDCIGEYLVAVGNVNPCESRALMKGVPHK